MTAFAFCSAEYVFLFLMGKVYLVPLFLLFPFGGSVQSAIGAIDDVVDNAADGDAGVTGHGRYYNTLFVIITDLSPFSNYKYY